MIVFPVDFEFVSEGEGNVIKITFHSNAENIVKSGVCKSDGA